MRSALLACFVFALSCPLAIGQELTNEQMGPWRALEKEIALIMERDWDEHLKYFHPKLCLWGDELPTPVSIKANQYLNAVFGQGEKAISHHLAPVSIIVVDDVAIINAYLHILAKQDDAAEETIYRLHNTWKKEGDRWQLLATYNTLVKTPEKDDD